jgi:hypothetical protein
MEGGVPVWLSGGVDRGVFDAGCVDRSCEVVVGGYSCTICFRDDG